MVMVDLILMMHWAGHQFEALYRQSVLGKLGDKIESN